MTNRGKSGRQRGKDSSQQSRKVEERQEKDIESSRESHVIKINETNLHVSAHGDLRPVHRKYSTPKTTDRDKEGGTVRQQEKREGETNREQKSERDKDGASERELSAKMNRRKRETPDVGQRKNEVRHRRVLPKKKTPT